MVALSGAEKAAVVAFLKSRRGQRALHADVVNALATFFETKGTSVLQLPTTPPPGSASDKEDWVEEWRDYAKDAGLTDTSDINNVARWISTAADAARSSRSGKAGAVADALTRRGLVLDRDAEIAVAAALVQADKGELAVQCRAVDVVWIIYTGESPGEDERAWFEDKRASMIGMQDGADPKVDIRTCKLYYKPVAATTVDNLERALIKDKSGATWARYYLFVIEKMNMYGFNQASMRWIDVCSKAKRMGSLERELAYLAEYFFAEHTGQGLPTDFCHFCASNTSGDANVLKAQQAARLRLTVPAEQEAMALAQPNAQMQQMQQQMMHMQHQLAGWQMWSQQMGSQQMTYPQQQQQQQQLPPQAGPLPPGTLPPDDAIHCAFCGSDKHWTDKCTKMHSKRKEFRNEQAAAAAAAKAQGGAATAAATAAAAAAAAADGK